MPRFFCCCLIALFVAFPVYSQNFPADSASKASGILTGTVLNALTQAPMPGVTVQVVGTKLGAISRAEGKFTVKNIPAGVYSIRASAIGFEPFIASDVVVSTGKPATLTIELQEAVKQLEGIEVEASYFRKSPEIISSTQLLNAEDVRRAPGVQEDVVRAVALLPGVGVTQAGRNDLAVRGGAPFENLFIVDNIEIPNINHFGSQGSTGGPLSLINIDFVREVSFSAGGFGARFGDRVSSLTNITLRDGNDERFSGEVNLSATGFGIIGEGPIGERGSYLFSVRRSYLDLIFKAAGFGFIPEYWDAQFKTTYRLNGSNTLSFLMIGAIDKVTFNNDDAEKRFDNSRVASPQQDQYFSGLTWKSLMEDGYLSVTLGRTFSAFDTRQKDSTLKEIFRNVSNEGETSLRADIFLQLSPGIELIAGNTTKFASQLKYSIEIPGYIRTAPTGAQLPLSLDTSFTAVRNGTHASIAALLWEKFRITAGARVDYYSFLNTSFTFSPRLTVSFLSDEVSSVNLTVGRYYQSPQFIWLIGDETNGANLEPIRADQIIVGYERQLAPDMKFQIEGYYKWYNGYPGRVLRPQATLAPSGFDDVSNDIPFGLEPVRSDATGFARGFEIFFQKKLSEVPLYGLISISVGETRFTGLDGTEHPGAFDTRAIVNLAAGYRFNDEWEVSAKFRAATGLPTTPFNTDGSRDFVRYNQGERLPMFHALDVRVDKRWNFTDFQLVTYIDVQNIYARKNISGVKWNVRTQSPEFNESIGVLPSIGVNVEF